MQLIVLPCSVEHKQMQSRILTQLEYTFKSYTCVGVMQAGLHYWMNVDGVPLSYNYNLCCCCCWEEFFRCQPYFTRRDYCVWSPADRLNDRSAVRRSHQLCHEPKQNLHGDCRASSTQAFYSSGTVNPALLTEMILSLIPAWGAPVNSH